MFDKTTLIIGGQPRSQNHYHQNKVEITEKRAPTDESVRLLKEMEREAEKKNLDLFYANLEDNGLSACVIHKEYSARDNKDFIVTIFTLNGKKFEVISKSEFGGFENKAKLCEQLRKEIADEIADEILKNIGGKL